MEPANQFSGTTPEAGGGTWKSREARTESAFIFLGTCLGVIVCPRKRSLSLRVESNMAASSALALLSAGTHSCHWPGEVVAYLSHLHSLPYEKWQMGYLYDFLS